MPTRFATWTFTVCALAVAPCLAERLPASAGSWPEFRGPTGQGHAPNAGLPLDWDTEENVAWVQPIPGKGWSSPIVHQGRIFLTTAVAEEVDGEPGQSLRVICIGIDRGEVLWDKELFRVNPAPIHKKNSHASPTPLTDGQSIFVHFGPNGTAALDLDGTVRWSTRVEYNARHGGGGSPILSGDRLIFNCDGVEEPFVVALDKATGNERWRSPRPEL